MIDTQALESRRVRAPERAQQVSMGAFYTLPAAAALLSLLANDAATGTGAIPWDRPSVWRSRRFWTSISILEPSCGTGELIVGWLLDARRRVIAHGFSEEAASAFCRDIAELSVTCLEVDRDSAQICANRIQAPVWLLPYGEQPDGTVRAGALELLRFLTPLPPGRLPFEEESLGEEKIYPEPGSEWMFLKTAEELAGSGSSLRIGSNPEGRG